MYAPLPSRLGTPPRLEGKFGYKDNITELSSDEIVGWEKFCSFERVHESNDVIACSMKTCPSK